MLELFDKSPRVRRFLWALTVLAWMLGMAFACYPIAALIRAVR